MSTKFMVNGKEKALEMRNANGIDWSADFIGNTAHGMESDDEGRYIASQEDFEWWKEMIAKYRRMEDVISEYKKIFNQDDVDRVVNDAMGSLDLEDQPYYVVEALEDAFGVL